MMARGKESVSRRGVWGLAGEQDDEMVQALQHQ